MVYWHLYSGACDGGVKFRSRPFSYWGHMSRLSLPWHLPFNSAFMAGKRRVESDHPYLPVILLFAASIALFLLRQYELFLVDMVSYDQRPATEDISVDRYTRVTIDFGNGSRR